MQSRREFLTRTVGASSLLAVGSVVPEFLASTAAAADKAEKGKDTILVVIELTGGNDGLNTVAPFGDDLYQRARPTLAFSKKQALALDDYCGLHPRMGEMKRLYDEKRLAVIQGVGYPNPDRSHFESMDIWQLGDPKRLQKSGWLARTIPGMTIKDAGVPGMYLGVERLPPALQGADGGVISLADRNNFRLQISGNESPRKKLIQDLNADTPAPSADLATFVRKRQQQTYGSLGKIEEALKEASANTSQSLRIPDGIPRQNFARFPLDLNSLGGRLNLIAGLITKELGTRIYYVQLGGFDTHSNQAKAQEGLLGDLSNSIGNFMTALGEHADRVALMTYSEFGRRVKENGSRGTDHGSGSCMFVAGNKVVGGLVGKHPSLADLTDGDLRYHTDFRRVYATLLDDWLGVESRGVLGDTFEKLPLIDHAKKGPPPAPRPAPPAGLPPVPMPPEPVPVKE